MIFFFLFYHVSAPLDNDDEAVSKFNAISLMVQSIHFDQKGVFRGDVMGFLLVSTGYGPSLFGSHKINFLIKIKNSSVHESYCFIYCLPSKTAT